MIKKIITTSVVMGAMISFIGCGGGSSSDEETDTVNLGDIGTVSYKDSAISGVAYVCGSQSGVTDKNGTLSFVVGKGCTFTLGSVLLREVHPSELQVNGTLWETNIPRAAILQTLDSDKDPSNGITINEATITTISSLGFDKIPETTQEIEAIRTVLENNGFTIVSEADAEAHLLISMLGDKTLYYYLDGSNILSKKEFNSNLTAFTIIENDGTPEMITIDRIIGNKLFYDEINYLEIVSTSEYNIGTREGTLGEPVSADIDIMYFNPSAVPGVESVPLEDIDIRPLVNVPLYYSDRGGVTAITFNSSFTGYSLTYSPEEVRDDLGVYGVRDTKILIEADNTYIQIEKIARDYIVIRDGNDNTGYIATETRKMYFNPADVPTTTALPLLLQDIGTIPYYFYESGQLTAITFSERFSSYTYATSQYINPQFITKIDGSKLHLNPAEYIEIIDVVEGVYVDIRHMQMNGDNWEVRYETRMYSTIETVSAEGTCYAADGTTEIAMSNCYPITGV